MKKRKLLLISDNRELYWFCSRKLSGRCDILHSELNRYGEVLSVYDALSFFCVLLDISSMDSTAVNEVRNYVAVNMDCPFFTMDSRDGSFPSQIEFICGSYMDESPLFLESPTLSFSAPQKKDYLVQLKKFAAHEEPVLLLGESGCGKSYSARLIHLNSSRKSKPFVQRNIAELNPSLIESELFGCVKGAYTDAQEREGIFEEAGDGTLFIDEIGELSLENQAKFYGVLEKGKFCRVGSTKEIPIRCRLVFATDSDLKARVKDHTFKKQLYWRLAKFVVRIPPLRERRDEIVPLALEFAKASGKKLSEDALAFLNSQDWEGNIRQLMYCIQCSAVLCDGDTIFRKDLVLF